MSTARRFKWLVRVECNINRIITKLLQRSRDMRAIVLKALTFAVLVFATAATAQAQDTYIIIGSGTAFTAFKNDETVGTANVTVQAAIDNIKIDARGNPCTIQFGNGRGTLSIDSANIIFDGGAGKADWGEITLAGQLTSSHGHNDKFESGVIYLKNGASINSAAEIENTASRLYTYAIYNESTGTVTISGGKVSASSGYGFNPILHACAIYNKSTGAVTVIDGNISATALEVVFPRSCAIYNESAGTVTINGGNISSTSNSRYGPQAYGVVNGSVGTVIVGGGSITGNAGILNESTGTVTINDGNVSGTIGVLNDSAGVIIVNGGNVSTTTASHAIDNRSSGTVTIRGGAISTPTWSSLPTFIYTDRAINNSTGTITVSGGSVSGISCDSANGSLIIGGSPEIVGRINGFSAGKISVITTGEYSFAPADKIYLMQLSSYPVDEAAVVGGADFLFNFMFSNNNLGNPATDYRLAASGNDLVIKAVITGAIYTVRFNLNGGTGAAPAAVSVLSGSRLPHVFAVGSYYDLSGRESDGKWYTDVDCTTEFVFGANGTDVTGDVTLYLKWQEPDRVLSPNRTIPTARPDAAAVVAPISRLTGEFTVGPNPIGKSSGAIAFFWQGKPIKSDALTVYDASGNVVKKISVSDKAVIGNSAKRTVGSWDLKDSKGGLVPEGTYLVKGKVVTFGGKGERVSVVVGVR